MYETDHPVYPQLQKIGREIAQKVKPKAVVVFSAHWQGERDVIEINTFENTELIYEYGFLLTSTKSKRSWHSNSFYGFPAKYYKETYLNKSSQK
jgi:aromatic ring-opening dioxygenase catalytic subunit (LigB family)